MKPVTKVVLGYHLLNSSMEPVTNSGTATPWWQIIRCMDYTYIKI